MHHFTYNHGEGTNFKSSIALHTEETQLAGLLEAFEDYLRGCGYHFDGKLAIVPDEEDDLP